MPLHAPPDQDIVIVGATGDLAQRKLIPALYNLHRQKLLPDKGEIIGAAPFDWDDQRFRDLAESAVKQFSRTPLQTSTFASFASGCSSCHFLRTASLAAIRPATTLDRRIAYLAVPPSAFTSLIEGIKTAGLVEGTSIIIEKPFGHDLKSAEELNRTLHDVVPEQRIFRIDHYMGKETVQNLLVFRFGNSLFERIWNREAISRVEITVAELLGVEQRGKLYEEIGAIRDIVQNHMFQVLSLVAMDPPLSFDAEAIRNEKVKVLAVDTADPSARRRPRPVHGGNRRGREGDRLSRGARASRPRRPPRRMRRCACTSSRGAGPACPSCCAPANACQHAIPAW